MILSLNGLCKQLNLSIPGEEFRYERGVLSVRSNDPERVATWYSVMLKKGNTYLVNPHLKPSPLREWQTYTLTEAFDFLVQHYGGSLSLKKEA